MTQYAIGRGKKVHLVDPERTGHSLTACGRRYDEILPARVINQATLCKNCKHTILWKGTK